MKCTHDGAAARILTLKGGVKGELLERPSCLQRGRDRQQGFGSAFHQARPTVPCLQCKGEFQGPHSHLPMLGACADVVLRGAVQRWTGERSKSCWHARACFLHMLPPTPLLSTQESTAQATLKPRQEPAARGRHRAAQATIWGALFGAAPRNVAHLLRASGRPRRGPFFPERGGRTGCGGARETLEFARDSCERWDATTGAGCQCGGEAAVRFAASIPVARASELSIEGEAPRSHGA
jgi:hypothetical protein